MVKNKISVTLMFFLIFISTYVLAIDKTIHVFGAAKQPDVSPSTGTYKAGYYSAFTLQNVDSDLKAENIKNGFCIFNTTGTLRTGLPDTGQLKSYSTYYAQTAGNPPVEDCHYSSIASSPSYTDNGDGTITDNITGLMWVKDGNSVGCNNGATLNWEGALNFCDTSTFAEYTDWRLPNVRELQSIVDYTKSGPSINTTYFLNTKITYYWSSTTPVGFTTNAWCVAFNQGDLTSAYNKINNAYVRPVRGWQ